MSLPPRFPGYPKMTYDREKLDRLWTDQGQFPPWHRVVAAGKDVTDEPVESWPPTYQQRYRDGWRPWTELPKLE